MNDLKSEKEYIFDRILSKYGDRLDEEQLAGIETNIDMIITMLEQIRGLLLKNSDEPRSIFKPYRKDRK